MPIPRPNPLELPDRVDYLLREISRPSLHHAVYLRWQYFWSDMIRANSIKDTAFNFEVDVPDFDWEPHRPLGEGGFGAVVQWVKKNRLTNQVVDEIALKEELRYLKAHSRSTELHEEGLTQEALLLMYLGRYFRSVKDREWSQPVGHLRGYKYQQEPLPYSVKEGDRTREVQGKYRYYFEYLPHGSLERLRLRYKAWRQPLPEMFIWWMFRTLADAMNVFSKEPTEDIYTREKNIEKNEILHFDIKPDNVCLGYATEDPEASWPTGDYPEVKLIDFGLAAISAATDPDNPSQYVWRGTRGFIPPEQLNWHSGIFGIEYTQAPNGFRIDGDDYIDDSNEVLTNWKQTPGLRFTSAHNVWAVGKTIYDLMSLKNRTDWYKDSGFFPQWSQNRTQTEQVYKDNGHHVYPVDAYHPRDSNGNKLYSNQLVRLVWRCTHPSTQNRPEISDILDHCHDNIARILGEVKPQREAYEAELDTFVPGKLFHKQNEINGMPLGTFNVPMDIGEKQEVLNHKYDDPDWDTLILPKPVQDDWAQTNPSIRRHFFRRVAAPFPNRHVIIRDGGKLVFIDDRGRESKSPHVRAPDNQQRHGRGGSGGARRQGGNNNVDDDDDDDGDGDGRPDRGAQPAKQGRKVQRARRGGDFQGNGRGASRNRRQDEDPVEVIPPPLNPDLGRPGQPEGGRRSIELDRDMQDQLSRPRPDRVYLSALSNFVNQQIADPRPNDEAVPHLSALSNFVNQLIADLRPSAGAVPRNQQRQNERQVNNGPQNRTRPSEASSVARGTGNATRSDPSLHTREHSTPPRLRPESPPAQRDLNGTQAESQRHNRGASAAGSVSRGLFSLTSDSWDRLFGGRGHGRDQHHGSPQHGRSHRNSGGSGQKRKSPKPGHDSQQQKRQRRGQDDDEDQEPEKDNEEEEEDAAYRDRDGPNGNDKPQGDGEGQRGDEARGCGGSSDDNRPQADDEPRNDENQRGNDSAQRRGSQGGEHNSDAELEEEEEKEGEEVAEKVDSDTAPVLPLVPPPSAQPASAQPAAAQRAPTPPPAGRQLRRGRPRPPPAPPSSSSPTSPSTHDEDFEDGDYNPDKPEPAKRRKNIPPRGTTPGRKRGRPKKK